MALRINQSDKIRYSDMMAYVNVHGLNDAAMFCETISILDNVYITEMNKKVKNG